MALASTASQVAGFMVCFVANFTHTCLRVRNSSSRILPALVCTSGIPRKFGLQKIRSLSLRLLAYTRPPSNGHRKNRAGTYCKDTTCLDQSSCRTLPGDKHLVLRSHDPCHRLCRMRIPYAIYYLVMFSTPHLKTKLCLFLNPSFFCFYNSGKQTSNPYIYANPSPPFEHKSPLGKNHRDRLLSLLVSCEVDTLCRIFYLFRE